MLKKYADGDTSQPDFDACLNDVRKKGNWKKESEVLFQAASRTIANRWKAMSKEDRGPFDKLAGEALATYRKEMKEYEDKMMAEALREARSIKMGEGATAHGSAGGGAYPGGTIGQSAGAAGGDSKPAATVPPAGMAAAVHQVPAMAPPGTGTGIYAYDLSNLTTAFPGSNYPGISGAPPPTINLGAPSHFGAFAYPGLPVENYGFPATIARRSIEQLILEERLRLMQQHQQLLQLLTGSLQPGRAIQQHFLLPPGAQHPTSVLDVSLLGRLDEGAMAEQRGTNPPAPSAEDPNLLARLMDELQRRNPRPPPP